MRKLLTVVFAVVIMSMSTADTASAVSPLKANQEYISTQEQKLQEKSQALESTSTEVMTLEEKKSELARLLDLETKTIEQLKKKLEEKRLAAEAEKKRVEELKNMFVQVKTYAPDSSGNLYAPGNCTWYVKQKRPDIGNQWGNANAWVSSAQAQGFATGPTPKKGAIAQTTSGWAGHVAYVEGVSPDGQFVTISEMNYGGLYNMNTRTVHFSEFYYIYEKA